MARFPASNYSPEEDAMSMLPQPGRPEEEEGESRPYYSDNYPDIQRPRRKFTTKIKILAFAVIAGTVLATFFSFVNTVLLFMSAGDRIFLGDRFGNSGVPLFFPTFVQGFTSYAPLFIVAATIAAAAEQMIRRASQSSSQQNRALIDALRELSARNSQSPQSGGSEIADPLLKNLNLEIDPRREDR
jgi:hypothetical protein